MKQAWDQIVKPLEIQKPLVLSAYYRNDIIISRLNRQAKIAVKELIPLCYNDIMDDSTQPIEIIRSEKLKKIAAIRDLGYNPYPAVLEFKITPISTATQSTDGESAHVAGRLTSIRGHGGIKFADIADETGTIQLAFKDDILSPTQRELLGLMDPADFVEVSGELFTTKAGELTIKVTAFNLLSKAIRPLPDNHEGIKDKEVRYRKRYLDLMINPETRRIFSIRHKIVKGIRTFLDEKGLTEVETPVLQPLYGGANAKPFTTHINALDTDAYLRIASELYLKRLVVGGIEGVYDIAKDFRNEGIDQTHYPEFSMLETYIPYIDYHGMMDVMEEMMRYLAFDVLDMNSVTVHDTQVNLKGVWKRVVMTDLIQQKLNLDPLTKTQKELEVFARENHLEFANTITKGELIFLIFDKLCADSLIDPTWVIDYPQEMSPLSKQHREKEGFVERFELYIGGVEIMDGWSEINDPIEQRARFEAEAYRNLGDGEQAQPIDEDFLEAMEHGLPPFAGIGTGIERLTMFFTNNWSIQEVILFPFKKPLPKDEPKTQINENIDGLPSRDKAHELLTKHVTDDYQRLHAKMIAAVLENYAIKNGENIDLWYLTGLLHDLDYTEYPVEHPQKECDWFVEWNYPQQLIHAIEAHAHERTNVKPQTTLAKMLVATDEIAGVMYAYAKLRPEGFVGMKPSSFKKKLKDKSFAPNISREDIEYALSHLEGDESDHFALMIEVFCSMPELKSVHAEKI